MANFDVNTDSAIELTAKLGRLHRSAFPSAVRNTLNDASFRMKRREILISAGKNFDTIRSKSFFTRKTVVDKARGWEVNKLKATVGFVSAGSPSVRAAVEGLRKQEYGGIVDDGARYLKGSRVSNSNAKRVRKGNYYDRNKVINGRSRRGGTRKSKFVARMYRSKKEDKAFFMNGMKGNFLVKTISIRKLRSGKIKSKLRFLMMSRSETPVNLKRTRFMTKAGMATAKQMNAMYRNNAEFQFKKHLK